MINGDSFIVELTGYENTLVKQFNTMQVLLKITDPVEFIRLMPLWLLLRIILPESVL